MALPADFNTVQVRGTYVALSGKPGQGRVTFEPQIPRGVWLRNLVSGVSIVPETMTATLDAEGKFVIDLPATDDEDVVPTNFSYKVTETINNVPREKHIQLPVDSGPLDLSSIADSVPVTATARTVRTINGVGPDASGNISITEDGTPTSHSVLADLATSDDHPQYMNQTRGDNRYLLGSAASGFAVAGHTHPISGVTGLSAALDGKAPAVHTHPWAAITDPPLIPVVFCWSINGAVSERVGTHRQYNDTGRELAITAVRVSAGEPPSGGPLTVAVSRGGAELVTASVESGADTAKVAPSGQVLQDGEYITVNVTAVGPANAGSDVTVVVTCQ